MMQPGFHASSLLLHDEAVAARELAVLGYRALAVRPHSGSLDPDAECFSLQFRRLEAVVQQSQMTLVIDVRGAFLPDPHRYAGPSLAAADSDEAARAEAWIARWIAMAAEHPIALITFASGVAIDSHYAPQDSVLVDHSPALDRLGRRINRLIELADRVGVPLALRPAAGDVIATVAQFERLSQWVEQPEQLFLTADVAEMLQGGEFPVSERLSRNMAQLACVFLCEREADRSRDQIPRNCEIDMRRIIASLRKLQYPGVVIARVDGHHERGLELARDALEWFQADNGRL